MTNIKFRALAVAALLPMAAIASSVVAQEHGAAKAAAVYAPITQAEVEAAHTAWCGALVAIATENDTKGQPAAKELAKKVLDSAYGYGMGPVLFKPTLTVAPQTFRTTYDGALAYFVGGDKAYPNDTGFALKGWRKCETSNNTILITGNSAMSMGNVTMWDAKGNVTKVDKTWGYVRGADGQLKIVLHHSSLPYTAK